MGRIPEHVVDSVRERADIVAVVSRHVSLRKQGVRHWGLCPFHSEKSASFQVHEQRQIFYCFGCGAGGDVFTFRMRVEGLDFPDAIRAVAREVGVEIPDGREDADGRVMQLYKVHDAAVEFFRDALRGREGAGARRYLESRAISQDLLERFRVGCAPDSWDALVTHFQKSGHGIALAEQAGLVGKRQQGGEGHYDRFRNRVVFPISEPGGRVIGFGGRALDDGTPKYLNSPETPVYRKGRALYGLAQAIDAIRGSRRVVVVEGYFDLLAVVASGIHEVVAPCGTALTSEHAARLRRYAQEVVLLFDGDEAGERAAERSLPLLLAEGLRVRAAFLPQGEDPDTFLRSQGDAALRAAIERAPIYLDWLLDARLEGKSGHAWSKSDATRALAPALRAIADPIERADYLRQLAGRLELPVAALEASLAAGGVTPASQDPAPSHSTAEGIDSVSRHLLEAILAFPDLAPRLEPGQLEALPQGYGRELLEQLVACAREYGERAIERLVSPDSERLSVQQRDAFLALATRAEVVERSVAERALRDCQRGLDKSNWDRESREVQLQIQANPGQEDALLLAKQRLLEERRAVR